MSIREKDTCINSMKILRFRAFVMILISLKNYTCVNSNGVHAMFDIPYNF